MLRKCILLAVALIVLGSTSAFAWSFPVSSNPGDCSISGNFNVNPDGTWDWDGYAWSSDTGDEVNLTVTFLDSNQNYLFEVSSHFDISVSGTWRSWTDNGYFNSGYFNSIGYYRVSTSG